VEAFLKGVEYVREKSLLQSTVDEMKRLCILITGSPGNTPIKGEIESRAFWIGHCLLNTRGTPDTGLTREDLELLKMNLRASMELWKHFDEWTFENKSQHKAVLKKLQKLLTPPRKP